MKINNIVNFQSENFAATLEKISYVTLLVTIVLGFLVFLPTSILALAVVKTFFIVGGTLISAFFFILSKIKEKSFKLFLHPLVWVSAATALVVLLSSLFSQSFTSSFFGKDFSAGTGVFLLISFVVGALSCVLAKGHEKRSFFIFFTILGSFSLAALFHIARFVMGVKFLSLGTFNAMTTTAIGSWHDFGVLAAVSLVISLAIIQLLPSINKIARAVFIVVFILASFVLVVVNLQQIWLVVTITVLAFSIYKYILNRRDDKKTGILSRAPLFPLIVTVISFIFLWSPNISNVFSFSDFINNNVILKTGAYYNEYNLPWNFTIAVAESTLTSTPIFGSGPDRFINEYLKYKPEVINATPFWSYDFVNGNSFITTSLVTEGIVGFVTWVILLFSFIWLGARFLLGKHEHLDNPLKRCVAATSYFAAALIWLSLLDYVPQHSIFMILFVLTGVFAAHMVLPKAKKVNFSQGPLKIPVLILFWIFTVFLAVSIVFLVKDTIAETYFESAMTSLNAGGSLASGAQKINTALKFNKNDVYYQVISQMDVYAVNQIISQATTTPNQATVQLINGLLSDGINSSRVAEHFDPTNLYNYLAEAQVSAVAAGIGYQGAYSNATSSYQEALTLDPLDPSIYLALSKLDFFEKNDTATKNDLNVALELKPNYTDALFEAGVVSYMDKDYATAVQAFGKVYEIDPTYPNIQSDINLAKAATSPSIATSTTIITTPQIKSAVIKSPSKGK